MEKIITRRVRESLCEGLRQAALAAKERGLLEFEALPEIVLEVPKEKSHGSFASNLALILAKVVRKAPRETAALLQTHFPANHYVERIEVAGPGFINFHLNRNWLREVQQAILEQQAAYGDNHDLADSRIQLEFVSANPVGPMVVVNARAAALGDTLGNLFSACGAAVQREYYVNDFGNQVYTLGRSIDARYRQLLGQTVEFPEDGYQGDYIYDLARQLVDERGDSYLALSAEERIAAFRDFGYRTILAGQQRDLAAYGVQYDCWFSERSLHEGGAVDQVVSELVARGLTYEQDGALWLKTTAYGDDKDRVLKTADGRTTYFVADIAYHLNKFARGFDLAIDIWGPDHHGYIPRMKAALAAMGIAAARFEVLIAQQINLIKDGQPFKMSKRRGDFITMTDLLEEVGNDGARWFLLMRSPDSHLDFDLDLVKSQTNENPVFYVQYAHARIASIFRQATPENLTAVADFDPAAYWDGEEELLLEKLAHFPDLISEAARRREPHRITGYLLELATLFHSYYNRRRFISEDAGQTSARLRLARAIGHVLERGLKLLGVSAPDRM